MSSESTNGIPVFPLLFNWDDGERDVYQSEEEMALDLEWFDSDDGGVSIEDSRGRSVRVRVDKFETIWCELIDSGT